MKLSTEYWRGGSLVEIILNVFCNHELDFLMFYTTMLDLETRELVNSP
jgi:hypothetical protein